MDCARKYPSIQPHRVKLTMHPLRPSYTILSDILWAVPPPPTFLWILEISFVGGLWTIFETTETTII